MLMLPSVVVRFRLRLGCGAVASRPQRSPDCPGRGWEFHFALVALVAQSSPSRNDDDQCRDAKDDSHAQVKRNGSEIHRGGWKERLERGEHVEASMKQDRHQHAPPSVIEDPSHDKRKAY